MPGLHRSESLRRAVVALQCMDRLDGKDKHTLTAQKMFRIRASEPFPIGESLIILDRTNATQMHRRSCRANAPCVFPAHVSSSYLVSTGCLPPVPRIAGPLAMSRPGTTYFRLAARSQPGGYCTRRLCSTPATCTRRNRSCWMHGFRLLAAFSLSDAAPDSFCVCCI